jgi:hypothetical protein
MQTLPAQQFCPLPPQGAQAVPPSPAWQDRPLPQVFAAPPPQQGWPEAPQAWHIAGGAPAGLMQAKPALQVPAPPPPPGQHG